MRRLLVAASAAALASLLVIAPAGAAPRATTGPPAFCATLDALLTHLNGSTAAARTPATRRAVVAVMHQAPRAVAKPAGTLGRSLLQLIDHGDKSVKKADKKRASKAGVALLTWGGLHCPVVREKLLTSRVQSALRDGLTNAKGLYTDTDSYTGASVDALNSAEPALQFTAGPATPGDPRSVSVHVTDATHIVMAASTGRTCFYISDDAMGVGTEFAQVVEPTCDAASPPPNFTVAWK
jgi:hypothetical protein